MDQQEAIAFPVQQVQIEFYRNPNVFVLMDLLNNKYKIKFVCQ